MSLFGTVLYQMPSVQDLLDHITEDLRQGRSVLGLLPIGIGSEEIKSIVWSSLDRWHLQIGEVRIDGTDNRNPVEIIADSHGTDLSSENLTSTVENLLNRARLPEVIFLDGITDLCEENVTKWLVFLEQWAKTCQAGVFTKEQDYDLPPALCMLAHTSQLPYAPIETNVLLSIRFWWGIPTNLEMQLMCQLVAEDGTNPQNTWKQITIPAIAGSDMDLAGFLWWQEYRTCDELIDILAKFAQVRNWDKSIVEDWSGHVKLEKTNNDDVWRLSPALFRAWSSGVVQWTPEYGIECHSAVLAILNRKEGLDHRLWRGQAGFLLPKIDETRLILCDHFSNLYGHDWAYKWQKPESEREIADVMDSSYACQWGHLKSLMKRKELVAERRWRGIVNSSWAIRTELAHYRPIDLSEYENYCLERERFNKSFLYGLDFQKLKGNRCR